MSPYLKNLIGKCIAGLVANWVKHQRLEQFLLLDEEIGHDETGIITVGDLVPDTRPGPEEQFLLNERDEQVRARVAKLPKKFGDVVRRHVGLDCEEQSIREIAVQLSISKSTASRLWQEGITRLATGIM